MNQCFTHEVNVILHVNYTSIVTRKIIIIIIIKGMPSNWTVEAEALGLSQK